MPFQQYDGQLEKSSTLHLL